MRLKMAGMGGGSVDYDELTAVALQVLEGQTFIGSDSEDAQTGTLTDRSVLTDVALSDENPSVPLHEAEYVEIVTDTDGNTRIALCPPFGAYPGGGGAYVGCVPGDVNIAADIIAAGEEAAGVAGTYGSDSTAGEDDIRAGKVAYGSDGRIVGEAADYGSVVETLDCGESYTINEGFYSSGKVTASSLSSQTSGTATAARILSGYTAWVSGTMLTGTMTDKSSTTTSATASLDSTNSRLRMKVPTTGYYNTSAYLYSTYSSIRSLIGLTAAKIVKGNTILGLTGTGTYSWTSKSISAFAVRGFGASSSDYVTSASTSYTMPAAGTVYYSTVMALYNASGYVHTVLYLNGSNVAGQYISGNYYWRSSIVNKSLSVSSGDVIKVEAKASSGTHALAFISAVCICFS